VNVYIGDLLDNSAHRYVNPAGTVTIELLGLRIDNTAALRVTSL